MQIAFAKAITTIAMFAALLHSYFFMQSNGSQFDKHKT